MLLLAKHIPHRISANYVKGFLRNFEKTTHCHAFIAVAEVLSKEKHLLLGCCGPMLQAFSDRFCETCL